MGRSLLNESDDPDLHKKRQGSSPTKRNESAERNENVPRSGLGLPVRIRIPRSDSASDSLYGTGFPFPIRNPRSRVNVGWEREGDRERMLFLQAEGVLSLRSPCFIAADKFLRGSRAEDAKTRLI
ncbi:hypothetical protein AVEN_37230-1 [Araneus ventricosus]|uniref:Uncharacterized protein n=1 Tax=Araneus ventricosus TaxID=182803 RepID=A0A4Y2MVB8_ARAVE|nr:hypothetical protein AVEN_37230-1 [Araneus ventricosus]